MFDCQRLRLRDARCACLCIRRSIPAPCPRAIMGVRRRPNVIIVTIYIFQVELGSWNRISRPRRKACSPGWRHTGTNVMGMRTAGMRLNSRSIRRSNSGIPIPQGFATRAYGSNFRIFLKASSAFVTYCKFCAEIVLRQAGEGLPAQVSVEAAIVHCNFWRARQASKT